MTFRNTKTKKSTTKKYRCVVKAEKKAPVEDKAAKITAIKQDKASSFTATFSADVTGVTTGAIKVVRDETNAIVTVKSITVDKKDNTKAVIETYEALTDGKAYTVTYTAADGTESSATFTATAGVVASIALSTYSIPENTPTEIKYRTLDASGVIIEEKGIGSSKSINMDITVENANGYQKDDELLLYKTGDTATIKAVYHTFKYNNTNGSEEGKVEETFTITAVDPSSVIETYEYTVADISAANTVDFIRDTLVTQVAVEDDKNSGKQPAAFFSFRKADGKDITKNLDYTVTSGNENVLLASGSVAEYAQLTPVAAGATYLIIKNASGAVVTTLPITVVAKRALSTMALDKSSVTIGQDTAGSSLTQKITVSVMDQYSQAYENFTAKDPVLRSSNDDTGLHVHLDSKSKNKISIVVDCNNSAKVGTYVYTVDLVDGNDAKNEKRVSFSVTVSAKLTGKTYALVMTKGGNEIVPKVNTTVTTDTFNPITLVPTIVVKNNNAIVRKADSTEIVSIGAISLTKNGVKVDVLDIDGKTSIYGPTANSITPDDYPVNYASIMVASGSGNSSTDPIKKYLEPGTYTVSFVATVSGSAVKQNMSTSFVVEDDQKDFAANVKVKDVEKGIDGLAGVFENTKYVTFSYANGALDRDKFPYVYSGAKYTEVNNKKSLNVEKVYMNVPLPGTTTGSDLKWVRMVAPVKQTFNFTDNVITQEMVDRDKAAEIASGAAVNVKNWLNSSSANITSCGAVTLAAIDDATKVSGSSIKVVGELLATGTSCAAITKSGVVMTITTEGAAENVINISYRENGSAYNPTSGALSNGDLMKIKYTITATKTVNNQTCPPVTTTVEVTYQWDGSKWEKQ